MGLYVGIFLVAFVTLALQVCLTRLLSVTTWYHLAFFSIGAAMLGMTAGAVDVFLGRERFVPQRLREELAGSCLRAALAIPLTLVLLCLLPIPTWRTLMSPIALMLTTAALFVPFRHCGVVTALVLTRTDRPVNRLYAADLAGAALGCLFVLAALEWLDACSAILLCAAIAALGGIIFAAGHEPRMVRRCAAACLLLAAASLINARSPRLIRPAVAKGSPTNPALHVVDRWNSFSRVTVNPPRAKPPTLWGPSAIAPTKPVGQMYMQIDGMAGTTLSVFRRPQDIEHLRFDLTNLGYYLRPRGGACIVGIGGGRDLQAALLFGHERVLGVEVNPIFVDLLRGELAHLSGLDRPDVEMVVDEARSYLSRSSERFALLQMSAIDTWAATGAGAFALTENGLYTVEAWRIMLDRLQDDGLFTVSRWFHPEELGETGRLVSLAVAALHAHGIEQPRRHLVLATRKGICTLLLCRRPFGEDELKQLDALTRRHGYALALHPDRVPEHPVLQRIIRAGSAAELQLTSAGGLRFDPPTDDAPYFFNMLSLGSVLRGWDRKAGVIAGNVRATRTLVGLLVCLLIVTLATIVVPLVGQGRRIGPVTWSAALYFSLIGAGFMLLEISLIQRMSVLLGHPTYALGILLFSMIASTGVGSLLSERLPLSRSPYIYALPVVAVGAIAATQLGVGLVATHAVASPMGTKIALCVALIFPLGMVLGVFFPTGMALVERLGGAPTPWYWALNGAFGVLCSAIAVFVSIFSGISTNAWIAATCYALVLPCIARLLRLRV